jgi:hypothetical protein
MFSPPVGRSPTGAIFVNGRSPESRFFEYLYVIKIVEREIKLTENDSNRNNC